MGFFFSSVQIVRRLMLDYGGLDILIDIISNSDDSTVQQTAMSSLVFLLQSVKSQSTSQHNYSEFKIINTLMNFYMYCAWYVHQVHACVPTVSSI